MLSRDNKGEILKITCYPGTIRGKILKITCFPDIEGVKWYKKCCPGIKYYPGAGYTCPKSEHTSYMASVKNSPTNCGSKSGD